MALNLSTPGSFKPRTISQNQYDIEGTLSNLMGKLNQGPQNAFSTGQMEDLAGRTLRDLRTQDQEAIAGAAQAQGARGVTGPNLASVYGQQMASKNAGAVGNAQLNAMLQGMNLGNTQYSNMSSLASSLGNLDSQQMARELTMILQGVRPEVAGSGMQIDPNTGLPILSGLGATTPTAGQATSNATAAGTSGSAAPDYTGYYTTGDSWEALVPLWQTMYSTQAQPGLMSLQSQLNQQEAAQQNEFDVGKLNITGQQAIEQLKQSGVNDQVLQQLVNSGALEQVVQSGLNANQLQELVNSGSLEQLVQSGLNANQLQELVNSGAIGTINAQGAQDRSQSITDALLGDAISGNTYAREQAAGLLDKLTDPEWRNAAGDFEKADIRDLYRSYISALPSLSQSFTDNFYLTRPMYFKDKTPTYDSGQTYPSTGYESGVTQASDPFASIINMLFGGTQNA